LPAEGKQENLDDSKLNAPVTTETLLNENNKEEAAMTRDTVRRSTRIVARGQKLDYSEFPRYDPSEDWTQPYGRVGGVAIAQSRIPGAGYGLYGVKPRTRNSMLFKEAGKFVCVYATEADLITCSEAQISDSDCIWTNSRQLHVDWDPEALYFDPSANRHYGKIINDHWKPGENSCKICWNEETKRVEV
jgi:hypothetical protein